MNVANRITWIIVGIILTVAGVVGTLAGLGVLPWWGRNTPLLPRGAGELWRGLGGWAPAVLIAAGVVIAVNGLLLFAFQLRARTRAPMPNLLVSDTRGVTLVTTAAMSRALTRDLRRQRDIEGAGVHLTGSTAAPRLDVGLSVPAGVDMADLRREVDEALDRFAATVGLRPKPRVVVRLGARRPA